MTIAHWVENLRDWDEVGKLNSRRCMITF